MSIIVAGGVYCPLSPRDPPQRLHQLIEQTKSRLVLVHSSTAQYLDNYQQTIDIDAILNTTENNTNYSINVLSDVKITSQNIAYVIFTSGSTGIPKAVCI